jgi:hypothetical protein
MLREEFNELAKSGYQTQNLEMRDKEQDEDTEEDGFKVIELKANGFDFAINIINQYYTPTVKPQQILQSIAQKILSEEKGHSIFFTYQNFSNKHAETFNSFTEFQGPKAEYWNNFKQDESNLEYLYSKTMSTWLCREIKEKDSFWSDMELPSWAPQELTNKIVEYIYPYYDGLDRMGVAYLYFPEGIQPHNEKKIIILLELARGIFLETIQRAHSKREDEKEEKSGKVLSLISGFFGKKKTG